MKPSASHVAPVAPKKDERTWHEFPISQRLMAMMLDGKFKEYSELRIGDIFRAVLNGKYVQPFTMEVDSRYYCVVRANPEKDYENMGWKLTIDVHGFAHIKTKVMH